MKHIFSTSRGALSVALLAAGVVGVGASSAFGSTRLTPHVTPSCSGTQVVNWLDTNGSGAAGSIYYSLKFTNLSGHSCTLRGYPGVSAVNLHGGQVGAPASRNLSMLHLITVANGATAKATLQVTAAGNYTPSTCLAKTAAGLKVYAPNQTNATIIPYPITVCSKAGKVTMYISKVTS